jgi:uncharacterized membrane protein YcaP (DUF421 family)
MQTILADALLITGRIILSFILLLVVVRLAGKKLINQLTYFDYVSGLVLGSITSFLALYAPLSAIPVTIWALVLWGSLSIGMSYLSLKSRKARRFIEGEPKVIVQNGKILECNLGKQMVNIDDLMKMLRQKGAFNIQDVEFAILEPTGEISLLKKAEKQVVTREDLRIPVKKSTIPLELIIDGEILEENLKEAGYDEKWLYKKLQLYGVKELKEVDYAHLDSQGRFHIDLKDDRINNPIEITDY